MHKIIFKNRKSFICDSNTTIFEARKCNGVILEYSCLTARCRSYHVQIEEGTTIDKLDNMVLCVEEKSSKWNLSCNLF